MSSVLINHILDSSVFECISRFDRNMPLIENIENIFSHLGENLLLVFNKANFFHIFINPGLPEIHASVGHELAANDERKLHYVSRSFSQDYETYRSIQNQLKTIGEGQSEIPNIRPISPEKFTELIEWIKLEVTDISDGILIPFDFDDFNLGIFGLWGEGTGKTRFEVDDKILAGKIAAIYYGLRKFLDREYGRLLPETYLPSLYAARWFRTAVMAADIHNFTPLSEVLRNIYAKEDIQSTTAVRDLLNEHCRIMAEIIQQESRGRIDRFVGPGVVAVFGEHEDHPVKACVSAVKAALQMVDQFRTLRVKFLRQAFGEYYDIESNEAIDIDLGIGIDYGTVLFDYLGDAYHREYTIMGDHVNFANSLKFEAGRFDPQQDDVRPAVLISPTVERCIRPWLKKHRQIQLSDMVRGMAYTAFGVTSSDFDHALYKECINNPKLWEDRQIWGKDSPPPRKGT